MGAAEKAATDFDPVPNHFAVAVFANRRHGLDCTLETVERMPRARSSHFKALVILIPADFTRSHKALSFLLAKDC
jgi:hypothetical protein